MTTVRFRMSPTRGQRLLALAFGVLGVAIALDRAREVDLGVWATVGVLVSLLAVAEVVTRATRAVEVTDEAVRVVSAHTERRVPLTGIGDVTRRVDDVELTLVDGTPLVLDPPVWRLGSTDASDAALALAEAIDAARREGPRYSTTAGLRRRPRGVSVVLALVVLGVAAWLVVERWMV